MAEIRNTRPSATRASHRRRVDPDRIKARRVELNLTQEELATEAGISARTVGSIEAGESPEPWSRTLFRLARALKVEPDGICVALEAAP